MGLLKKTPEAPAAVATVATAEVPASEDLEAALPEAALEPADAAAPPEATSETAPAADTDALLSMFTETDSGAADRELIVSMAGEVALPDLIDQLHIVAAALYVAAREAA